MTRTKGDKPSIVGPMLNSPGDDEHDVDIPIPYSTSGRRDIRESIHRSV